MTIRQLTFAANVARGKTNKQAAIAAGYSARSAGCTGSQLVKQPEVEKCIQELRSAGAFEAPPCVTPEAVLQRLTERRSGSMKTEHLPTQISKFSNERRETREEFLWPA